MRACGFAGARVASLEPEASPLLAGALLAGAGADEDEDEEPLAAGRAAGRGLGGLIFQDIPNVNGPKLRLYDLSWQ